MVRDLENLKWENEVLELRFEKVSSERPNALIIHEIVCLYMFLICLVSS